MCVYISCMCIKLSYNMIPNCIAWAHHILLFLHVHIYHICTEMLSRNIQPPSSIAHINVCVCSYNSPPELQNSMHTYIQAHVTMAAHCSTVAHCNTLQHPASHCSTLQHPATHCDTLQRITIPCITLQHVAPHCHTLQHPATPCNTLQHPAATQCSTS